MLICPPTLRIFLVVSPVDLRGSFHALAGHVRRMGKEPSDGHLYLFLNKRRHLLKILYFDRSGWCIFQKRLERGTFQLPSVPPGAPHTPLDPATLSSLLEGICLDAPKRRWYRREPPALPP